MNTRLNAALIIAMGAAICPVPAAAQTDAAFGAFAALVKRIDNLAVYQMTAVPRIQSVSGASTDPDLKSGVGFELILLVTEWGAKPAAVASAAPGKLTEIQVKNGDTTRTYTPAAGDQPDQPWTLELGFAYNDQPLRLTGPNYEIRGSLRDQPAISLYFSHNGTISPYAGLRFSSYNLVGARAYVEPGASDPTMRVFAVTANDYSLGIVAGASLSLKNLAIFAETEFARRSFESLQWADNSPSNFPRGLKVSSPSLWVGFSIDLGRIFGS